MARTIIDISGDQLRLTDAIGLWHRHAGKLSPSP